MLEGLMEDWPALRRWSLDYLRDRCGGAEVEIMSGRDANPDHAFQHDRHRTTVRSPSSLAGSRRRGRRTTSTWCRATRTGGARQGQEARDVLAVDLVLVDRDERPPYSGATGMPAWTASDGEAGEAMILRDNIFVEQFLPKAVLRTRSRGSISSRKIRGTRSGGPSPTGWGRWADGARGAEIARPAERQVTC
jgi:hypothetical protein